MGLHEAMCETGFEMCVPQDAPEPCEKCGAVTKQLFFRSDGGYEPRDGQYHCGNCVIAEAVENEETLSRLAAEQD